jgi:hypothetical protein
MEAQPESAGVVRTVYGEAEESERMFDDFFPVRPLQYRVEKAYNLLPDSLLALSIPDLPGNFVDVGT